MKLAVCLSVVCGMTIAAQTNPVAAPAAPLWRSSLSTLPAAPPPNTTAQDVVQFERNMRMAAAYLGNTTPTANPAQWEANRALVRRMATYLYGLQALSGNNGGLRGPITRAQQSFNSLGFAPYLAMVDSMQAPYQDQQPAAAPVPQQQLPPPFAMSAPESTGVSDADKEVAAELHTRYETDAAHSAGVWQNAEVLRQSLAERGLGLNLPTATAMVRLPLHFTSAANALRRNDWEAARTHLEQAEAETEKIAKTVGR